MTDVLPDGSVVLFLDGRCVRTTAREAHRGLAAALLTGGAPAPGTPEAVDLLAAFLAATDFAALRAAHPGLDGCVPARIRIFRDAAGGARWEASGTP